MSDTNKVSVKKLTAIFLKIKEKREELKREFDGQDNLLKEKQEIIKAELGKHLEEHDQTSVNTEAGTFYRKIRTNYWTSDWGSLHKFILEHKCPELLSNRIHQTNLKTFMDENPDVLPAGLNIDREYVVTVNKPRKS